MEKYTTEYLILHEYEIDWDTLSRDKDDSFSFIEVRLFRKRINWKVYLVSHQNQVNTDILEVASKYFTPETYDVIASFGIATQDFIEKHLDCFKDLFKQIIENCNIDEEFILKYSNYWSDKNIDFTKSHYINLDEPRFSRLKLYLEAK